MDELVALLDADGRVCGSAPRSVMRRDNLRHAATGVLVRTVQVRSTYTAGHPRRTSTRATTTSPPAVSSLPARTRTTLLCARLDEELGITGVELIRLPEGDYADDRTAYHAYLYTCVWDGPVRHQPEEVEWGTWMSPAEPLGESRRSPLAGHAGHSRPLGPTRQDLRGGSTMVETAARGWTASG